MPAPVFGSLVPLVGRINSSILAINQVRWFTWSLFYQEYVEQGYADIYDPTEPGVVVALQIDGTVATYSALPTAGLVAGAVYVVGDTGRAYVWNGSSWPAENVGIAIQGPRGYTGNGVDSVTVAGNSLVFHMTDGVDLPPVHLDVLADLQDAADTAVQARGDALEAAGISVVAAEFADRRAGDADEAAIEAAFSASEASATVAAQLAGKADRVHAHADKADLGPDGKLVQAQIPAIAMTTQLGAVSSQSAMLALVGERGDWCIRTDKGTVWVLTAEPSSQLSSWVEWMYPASPVSSVFGRTGAVTGSKADVGLGNVDNTKDSDKPLSGPQLAALTAQRDAITLELLGKAARLVDRGNWIASTSYQVGDVVTAQYARWYCKTAHSSASSFSETNWIFLGLAAIGATTDPGVAGRLWVKI